MKRWNTHKRSAGFTLIESAIGLGILSILIGSIFTITAQSSSFLRDFEEDVAVQMEARRAFTRIGDLLRKSGPMEDGGVEYPRVVGEGSALEFRLGQDLDGNGYSFEAGTGQLEWDPRVFTLRLDAQGNLDVYVDTVRLYPLARNITNLQFATVKEDNTLHLKEVAVSFAASREMQQGGTITFPVEASVHLRN